MESKKNLTAGGSKSPGMQSLPWEAIAKAVFQDFVDNLCLTVSIDPSMIRLLTGLLIPASPAMVLPLAIMHCTMR